MNKIESIKSDQVAARKAKDTKKASILTTLLGEAQMIGKNDGNRQTTDDECVKVIKKFIKGIDETLDLRGSDSILEYEKRVLEGYLPVQFSDEKLESVVRETIEELGASSKKDMGKVMGQLNKKYGGMFDGKTASNFVKSYLV